MLVMDKGSTDMKLDLEKLVEKMSFRDREYLRREGSEETERIRKRLNVISYRGSLCVKGDGVKYYVHLMRTNSLKSSLAEKQPWNS